MELPWGINKITHTPLNKKINNAVVCATVPQQEGHWFSFQSDWRPLCVQFACSVCVWVSHSKNMHYDWQESLNWLTGDLSQVCFLPLLSVGCSSNFRKKNSSNLFVIWLPVNHIFNLLNLIQITMLIIWEKKKCGLPWVFSTQGSDTDINRHSSAGPSDDQSAEWSICWTVSVGMPVGSLRSISP